MSVYVGERDVLRVEGPDAASYLQGQISQDVTGLAIGDSAWSLILQPQGKVDAWFRITRADDERYLLDVDAGFGEVLLARVKRFMLRVKVDLELSTWVLHAYDHVLDPAATAAPIVASSVDGRGTDVIGPELEPPRDNEHVDAIAHERRRIEAGIPAMGSELDESTIPAEAGIVNRSVSFTKGCYTGQELVARVDSRGDNTPRRLRIIEGNSPLPEVGAELLGEDKPAGVITSVASSGDDWIALGYVRRSFLDQSDLLLDGETVSVRPTPSDLAESAPGQQ